MKGVRGKNGVRDKESGYSEERVFPKQTKEKRILKTILTEEEG